MSLNIVNFQVLAHAISQASEANIVPPNIPPTTCEKKTLEHTEGKITWLPQSSKDPKPHKSSGCSPSRLVEFLILST